MYFTTALFCKLKYSEEIKIYNESVLIQGKTTHFLNKNRKLPLTYNVKTVSPTFSQLPLIGSLSNLQVTRTGIKSGMRSNLGQVRLFTTELFAFYFEWGKMVSPSFLSYCEFSLHQTYRKLGQA